MSAYAAGKPVTFYYHKKDNKVYIGPSNGNMDLIHEYASAKLELIDNDIKKISDSLVKEIQKFETWQKDPGFEVDNSNNKRKGKQ